MVQDKTRGEAARAWVVLSLGGSLIVPRAGIDAGFLRRFRAMVRDLLGGGMRLVVITGGGRTARDYQGAAADVVDVPDEDLDWLGIHATRLNAHLVRTVFREEAYARLITNPEEDDLPRSERLIIGAGWKPGWSTDYDAALIARRLGARRIVNASNVTHVHSADPQTEPSAQRFDRMTWKELRRLTGEKWKPGLNTPFDPIAAKLCDDAGIEAAIVSGADLLNLERALRGEPFEGTLVKD